MSNKQHGGGAGIELGLVNRKILGPDAHRHAAAAQQRVLQGLDHVDVQRIALHVGPAAFEDHLLAAAIARRVAAHAVAAQLLINIAQRQLADAPHAFGSQLEAIAAARARSRPLRAATACA